MKSMSCTQILVALQTVSASLAALPAMFPQLPSGSGFHIGLAVVTAALSAGIAKYMSVKAGAVTPPAAPTASA